MYAFLVVIGSSNSVSFMAVVFCVTLIHCKISFLGYEPYSVVVYNAPICYPEYPNDRSKRYSTGSLVSTSVINIL